MLDEATIRKIEDRYVIQHLIARQAGLSIERELPFRTCQWVWLGCIPGRLLTWWCDLAAMSSSRLKIFDD